MKVYEVLEEIGIKIMVKDAIKTNWRGEPIKKINSKGEEVAIMEKQLLHIIHNTSFGSDVRTILENNINRDIYKFAYNNYAFLIAFKKIGTDVYVLSGLRRPMHDHWMIEREDLSDSEQIDKFQTACNEMQPAGKETTTNEWEQIKMIMSLGRK